MKYCRKCGTTKPVEEFYKDRSKPDGYHHLCKACKNAVKMAYRAKNPEVERPGNIIRAMRNQKKYALRRHERKVLQEHMDEVWPEDREPVEAPWPQNSERKEDIIAALKWKHDRRIVAKARQGKSGPYYPRVYKNFRNNVNMRRYALQQYTDVELEIDHIVPLCGDNFCGLLVPWNERIVSAQYNRYKGNKLDRGAGWGERWNFEEVDPPETVYT